METKTQLTLWYESMMASARYSHFAIDNPASDILPSLVMYTCHLFVMLSLCSFHNNKKKHNANSKPIVSTKPMSMNILRNKQT